VFKLSGVGSEVPGSGFPYCGYFANNHNNLKVTRKKSQTPPAKKARPLIFKDITMKTDHKKKADQLILHEGLRLKLHRWTGFKLSFFS